MKTATGKAMIQIRMTKGKLKGLDNVSDEQGVIRAAAMDQRGSLQKSIAKAKGVELSKVTASEMSEFKKAVSKILTPHASAILLDPEFGLDAARARAKGAGLLLAYETTGYDQTSPGRLPELIPNYTVRRLIQDGADCVKVLIYYNPFEKKEINEKKHAFVARIGAECGYHDVPFFLEFVRYPLESDTEKVSWAKKKPEIVKKSMEEFSKPEYGVDVLKVEIPVDLEFVEGTKACQGTAAYSRREALERFRETAGAAKKPFIYLSAGVANEVFIESLELAIEAGVDFAGVLCGRATWKDGVPVYALQGVKALENWLQDQGVKNITALNRVLAQGAKSWYTKYGTRDAL